MHAYSETGNMQTSMEAQDVAFDLLYGVALMGEGCHAFIVLELGFMAGLRWKSRYCILIYGTLMAGFHYIRHTL